MNDLTVSLLAVLLPIVVAVLTKARASNQLRTWVWALLVVVALIFTAFADSSPLTAAQVIETLTYWIATTVGILRMLKGAGIDINETLLPGFGLSDPGAVD